MIYRIFPIKDTAITSYRLQNVAQTGSNVGSSETLGVFSVAAVTSSAGYISGSASRLLTKFDLSQISKVTGSATGIRYRLRLADAQHSDMLPTSYDMEVFKLSTDWDEGTGFDDGTYADSGFANWIKAKSNVYWTVAGGDISSSIYSVFHFDSGHEDLSVDVTEHVNSWMSGSPNYGFMVRISSSMETGSSDLYIKKFHARETHFPDRMPYLEASWDDSVKNTGSVTFSTGDGPFVVQVKNLHDDYRSSEKARLHLYVRPVDYNPAVVTTSSAGPLGVVVSQSYYSVINDRTQETVIDFGTGSVETTRLSYNLSGSYFDLYMGTLPPDSVYRLLFLFDTDNESQLIDSSFKFKVRR